MERMIKILLDKIKVWIQKFYEWFIVKENGKRIANNVINELKAGYQFCKDFSKAIIMIVATIISLKNFYLFRQIGIFLRVYGVIIDSIGKIMIAVYEIKTYNS